MTPDKFNRVAENFWVSPQICVEDLQDARAMGVRLIINNRPDGEAPGQPSSAEIETAAKAAGIGYAHIPVGPEGITPDKMAAFEKAMADHDHAPTLAYCKSGTRSILVLAYASARIGKPVDQIISQARSAGYNIAGHKPSLDSLAGASLGSSDKN